MIGAVLWRALLLAAALVAIAVQFDRQAERSPEIAEVVPSAFRSTAQPRTVAMALSGGDPTLALEEARTLVERRPLPAEHLRLLSLAQARTGNPDAAVMTVQYAAQRGWRDGLVQEAMLRLALDNGDETEAARRFTALMMNSRARDEGLEAVASELLDEDGGTARATVAAIMGGDTRLQRRFVSRGARVLPPDAYIEIIERMAETGSHFECRTITGAQTHLTSRDSSAGRAMTRLVEEAC